MVVDSPAQVTSSKTDDGFTEIGYKVVATH